MKRFIQQYVGDMRGITAIEYGLVSSRACSRWAS